MQATADISKALSIAGWMSERELLWLASMAKTCRIIVEFGSFHGRSARALADNMPLDGKLWCVDPWDGIYKSDSGIELPGVNTYVMPYFKQNLRDHIDAGRVIPVRQYSYNFTLPFEVDMVFIDGDHTYKTVPRDIEVALKLLKPNGIISGHDYQHPMWPGVKDTVDKMFGPVSVEDSIWWTQKSSLA